MTEYQRGLEAAAQHLEERAKEWEVMPIASDNENPASPILASEFWAVAAAIRGLTPQPERGDPTIGRTIDEDRRPLVCFVCGNRFGITFNFCLEHKNEYEKLKREDSVEVPQPAKDEWLDGELWNFVHGLALDLGFDGARESTAIQHDMIYRAMRSVIVAYGVKSASEIASAIMASPAFKAGQAATRKMLDWEPACPLCGSKNPNVFQGKCADYRANQEPAHMYHWPSTSNEARAQMVAPATPPTPIRGACPLCGSKQPDVYLGKCSDYQLRNKPGHLFHWDSTSDAMRAKMVGTPPTPQPTILMCSCGSEFKPQCPDCKKLHDGRAGVPAHRGEVE